MRLGDFLAFQQGEEQMDRLQLQGVSRWGLEESFQKQICQDSLIIRKVVDPNNLSQPFVLLWSTKHQDHSSCPLFNISSMKVNVQYHGEGGSKTRILGLSECEDTKQSSFKPWEEWEKGKRLHGMFKWKVHKDKGGEQVSDSLKEPKIRKVKHVKVNSEAQKCRENIKEQVKKLLLSSYKSKTPNKKKLKPERHQVTEGSSSTWKGPRPAPSEVPQVRRRRGNMDPTVDTRDAYHTARTIPDQVLVSYFFINCEIVFLIFECTEIMFQYYVY